MSSIRLIFLFFFACIAPAFAQTDSLTTNDPAPAAFDTTKVNVRHIDEVTLADLKKSPEFDYGTGPAASSLWQRFMMWLKRFLQNLVDTAVEIDWLVVLIEVLVVIILIYVIMRLLHVDALKIFYSGAGKSIQYQTLDDNIHEMDFDKLINEAIAKSDFRMAIRLQFLQALKILSDKHLIHWQPGKTNHDYLDELQVSELKKGFDDLNFYFEYAWYGNFRIAPELYGKVRNLFNDWRAKA